MSMFQQAKDMYKMQKQAKEIKKKLANIHIEAESSGVKIVIDAQQEVISVEISEDLLAPEKKTVLENAIKDAFKKGTKKAQEVAALEMKVVMGDMGFPGMGGG